MMFSVCLLSRYMENPTNAHMQAAKRVFKVSEGYCNIRVLFHGHQRSKRLLHYQTTEAEFVAATFYATQCIWLKRIVEQIGWNAVNNGAIKNTL
ncbi:hypothetical protein LINPERHAP1_LOCUS27004 [Linum perenne]